MILGDSHMNRSAQFLFAIGLLGTIGCGTRSSEETPAVAESTSPKRDAPRKIEPRLSDDLLREPELIKGSATGLVSLDGQPLATGSIEFSPPNDKSKLPIVSAGI